MVENNISVNDRLPTILGCAALMTASFLFAGCVGEVMVRWLVPTREQPQSVVFMTSSPHVRLDTRGAVRHIPNETVRLVAIYDGSVEFDMVVRTNSHGLVDHRDYPVNPRSSRHYALVGNSFAYGMGAEPWVPKLRDALRAEEPDIEIYNLGLSGASVQHYRKLVSSVAAELPLTHIVAIAISNDFYRPWWEPGMTSAGMQLCRKDRPLCTKPPVLIDRGAPLDELLKRAQALAEAAESERRMNPDPAWKRALWRSRLYLLVRAAVRRVYHRFVAPEPEGFEDPALLDVNLEALAGMRADFPSLPITLAHFPQKEELEAGHYLLRLDEQAAKLGMDYFPALTRCSWSKEMYHRLDGHPNENGYQNFADCLSKHLFGSSRS